MLSRFLCRALWHRRISDDTRLWFECALGNKSHLNLAGKIVLLPLILIVGLTWAVLDVLFTKRDA